ncbi:flagellar protein FliT [Stutzerimonas kunmingensis]|uniref:flagellar protein FliT n=1 Tax=Stutzerimonas kunmingensis TaxID=1211807 RepID=UPI00241CF1AE|nr:flagellar protein FliT [Stutzerimonas kunmingensis]
MQSTPQSLEELRDTLREALSRQDWEAIGALDSQCRALVGGAAGANDPALRERIVELSQVYAELQQAARTERERIADELTRLNQSKRVDQAYNTFG